MEVWAFWFLDTESERERTVKDNIARTSTATRRVGCCPRGTSRIRSFLGFTPSTPLTRLHVSSVHRLDVLFYLTLLCSLACFSRFLIQGCRSMFDQQLDRLLFKFEGKLHVLKEIRLVLIRQGFEIIMAIRYDRVFKVFCKLLRCFRQSSTLPELLFMLVLFYSGSRGRSFLWLRRGLYSLWNFEHFVLYSE